MNAYALFNAVEGTLWILLGTGLLAAIARFPKGEHSTIRSAAILLFFFGVSDWLEMPHNGRLPLSIWALKLFAGAGLAWCWYQYIGIDRNCFADQRAILGVGLLVVVWLAIAFTLTTQP